MKQKHRTTLPHDNEAEIVRDKAQRRTMVDYANKLTALARDRSAPVEDAAGVVEALAEQRAVELIRLFRALQDKLE